MSDAKQLTPEQLAQMRAKASLPFSRELLGHIDWQARRIADLERFDRKSHDLCCEIASKLGVTQSENLKLTAELSDLRRKLETAQKAIDGMEKWVYLIWSALFETKPTLEEIIDKVKSNASELKVSRERIRDIKAFHNPTNFTKRECECPDSVNGFHCGRTLNGPEHEICAECCFCGALAATTPEPAQQPDTEYVWNCRFHPTGWWHEIGCPHLQWNDDGTVTQASDAASEVKP